MPRLLLVLGAGLAVLPGAARGQDDDPEGAGPLPWRVRGEVGFTVDAAAFPDSAGHTLEVYVRVPPATLASLARDAAGGGRLRLALRLTNRFGARQHEASQEFAVAAVDSAAGFGKVVLMRFPVRSGGYGLRVRLDDLLSRKRGLGYIGRRVTKSSTVKGELTVAAPQAGRDLSDLEFVWTHAPAAGATAFQRGERVVLPNPERLYGVLASELRAAFTARGLPGDARPWRWHARVLDARGGVVAEQEGRAAAAALITGTVALDLSTGPAGGYDLEVKVWQEGDAGALVRTAHFSVAWQPSSWMVDPADLDDVVHFLLSAADEERFADLHPGERERFLEDFWRRRDPTPDTAENEAKLEFLARVDHANRTFGRPGKGRGMFSDMGRVYIRYGEPDEILKQVIPAGDATLLQAIRELELAEDRPTGDVHQKGLGGDTRPYEVWIYEGSIGAPPDVDPSADSSLRSRRRLVFLFVDEQGYGDYRLRYSTE